MRASMSQTQNLPQHRTIIGIPSGGSFHNSTAAVPSQPRSSIASFANSLGGPEYRNAEVQPLETSSSRWQVPGLDSDLHVSARWPNNSNETSGHGSPALDAVSAAYSELFDSSIRGTDGQQQQFMDGSGRFSGSVASMLPGDSPGFGRTASSPLGGALVSSSPRLCQGWKSTVDHGNLGLTVDPSKGGLALQGVLGGRTTNTQSLPRFSPNPGFAERAARFSAFGNGPYSAPSFPLTENGNVGRSPSFENDCSKAAKASVSASRSEVGPEISGRNSVPHSNALEGKGGQRGREHGNARGGPKASGRKASATPGCSQVDQDDVDEGLLAEEEEEEERASWDSEASGVCRGQQETSCADQIAVGHLTRSTSNIGKKRKNTADVPDKEASSPSLKEHKGSGGQQKRCKDGEAVVDKDEQKTKPEWSGSENSGLPSPARKDGSKTVEQPKLDYIHVRARRGQATDSHSLAERVRREKISERMKYLQDLVPGCSKVTGKAVMLDEIINYVQSIQRQVEFLSMKLAAVTPRADFNIDSIVSKQLQIGNGYGDPNVVEHADTSLPFSLMQSQQPVHMLHGVTHSVDFQPPVDMNLRRMNGTPMPLPRTPIDAFDIRPPQAANIWDGDLQSVVQMGFGQGMQGFGLSGLQCDLPPGHMKMEL